MGGLQAKGPALTRCCTDQQLTFRSDPLVGDVGDAEPSQGSLVAEGSRPTTDWFLQQAGDEPTGPEGLEDLVLPAAAIKLLVDEDRQ